ncbi:MAG TPA: hypothetical protein VMN77_06575, partial [Nitrospiria bacterium]|nr:hypothetical protein [Nitrospiria bacterium]
ICVSYSAEHSVIPREPNRKVAEKPESDDSILLRVFYVIVANLNRMITHTSDRGVPGFSEYSKMRVTNDIKHTPKADGISHFITKR